MDYLTTCDRYFSVDPTQLQVLSMSGTPKQQKYALRILPVRLVKPVLRHKFHNPQNLADEPILQKGFPSTLNDSDFREYDRQRSFTCSH